MPWVALLLAGLRQEPPWCFLHHGLQQYQHQSTSAASTDPLGRLSPTSSTTMSFPCPPHPPSISERGKESKEVAACKESPTRCQDTQGLDSPSPGGTQGDETPNVLILPGLRLL